MSILETEGTVQVSRSKSPTWDPAYLNQPLYGGDRVRTRERSRALVRLSHLTTWRLDQLSVLELPEEAQPRSLFNLLRGALYFFHRDAPGTFPVKTPTMSAIVRGTEFVLRVEEDGTSTLFLLDGEVEVGNELGALRLVSGEAATAAPGKPPVKTAVIEAINIVQWALYYPGILDLADLQLGKPEQSAISDSLAAYATGDLLKALATYPADRQPTSVDENIYLAALLLSVGQVNDSGALLRRVPPKEERQRTLVAAISNLIEAVQIPAGTFGASGSNARGARVTRPSEAGGATATELLAQSYLDQSQLDLDAALNAARKATEVSPRFGFAWSRVAELEFSFGRINAAEAAVERALELSPRNAQALAVRGFLLAAENRIARAIESFDAAIAIDGALGNAWLGRGLAKIRRGDVATGIEDLQVAATLEPQRSVLRSYLGKGYSQAPLRLSEMLGRADRSAPLTRAEEELQLARKLDPNDPTPFLYSALLKQQQNRVNEAVADLERSQELNDNRAVYRSRLLLDQDRTVGGVNLASIYQDAGLHEPSLWEASRAVNSDYTSFSSHLFLANSYQSRRDFRGVNLRYETPAVSEYLLANLLAPVGAGTLAQTVTQQEYSKLFESDGLGLASETEYLSRGAWLESGAQYGTFGDFSYAASALYEYDPGQRHNNDLEQEEYSLQLKYEITRQDSVYLRGIYGEAESGDLGQYFDPDDAERRWSSIPWASTNRFRVRERQDPILLAGYHREWTPEHHTLVLAGRLEDTVMVNNPGQQMLVVGRDGTGAINAVEPITIEQSYRNELEIYTAEAQHIWDHGNHRLIAGARYQSGVFHTDNTHGSSDFALDFLLPKDPPHEISSDFERFSAYAYHAWQVWEPLQLSAGLTYDRLVSPQNFRYAPLVEDEEETDRLSPKAGVIWTPTKATTVRGAYTRSLGGVSFDQSFRLEPTQVAGFNQAYRSIAPETVVGANSAERFETFGLSLEQRIGTATYLGLGGEVLRSKINRLIGVYDFVPFTITRGATTERLEYEEGSVLVTANQLLGHWFSFGAHYRLSYAELDTDFTEIPASAARPPGVRFPSREDIDAWLHQVNLVAIFNHPSGFFSEAAALWYRQDNDNTPGLDDSEFWQFNGFIGYRLSRRGAELRLGVLNITDQDYKLNPLNLSGELPRERTVFASLRFYF